MFYPLVFILFLVASLFPLQNILMDSEKSFFSFNQMQHEEQFELFRPVLNSGKAEDFCQKKRRRL